MIEYKNINDPSKLRSIITHLAKSYQSLGEKFMEMNDQLVSQLAINEIVKLEAYEKDAHIKKLTDEIVNLYRELGETKYQMSINIDELIPEQDNQICLEFVEGYKIS